MTGRRRKTKAIRPLSIAVALLASLLVTSLVAEAATRSGRPYRPPRIRPDGAWHATGNLVAGRPPLLVTTFHPDPRNPGTVAYAAWIDHTRTAIGLYPGLYEPPGASPRGPASIPSGERWRLVAAFNGGFKYGHGVDGGFSVDGHTYVWLRRGLGTVVGYRDGRVDIVSWRGGPTPAPGVAFARQNLPLIVERGRPSPRIGNGLAWGATLDRAAAVWRTGIGIDRRGNLIYAAAPNETAAGLADVLIRAGSVRAIELDINPEWPTFDVYAHSHGLHPVMFVPNFQQSPMRYLSPDTRDFFAVYRRLRGEPAGVPFR